jgi:hypothetical protein
VHRSGEVGVFVWCADKAWTFGPPPAFIRVEVSTMATPEEIDREHRENLRELPPLQAAAARLRGTQAPPAEIVAAHEALRAWNEQSHDIIRRKLEAVRAERT